MIRWLAVILTGVITSLFLFPFNLPLTGVTVNTKMIMAVIGGVLLIIDKIKEKGPVFSKKFLVLSLICVIVSAWALFVTLINDTGDYAFAKYLISVWVWLAAAYAVVWAIRATHGELSVKLIGNYLLAVCAVQCALAYSMTIWPALGSFVDGLMGEGEMFMGVAEDRMHGLGAALDPAGLRFSSALVINAVFLSRTDFVNEPMKGLAYLTTFVIITVIGNMIARSTTIGVLISIPLFVILTWPGRTVQFNGRAWGVFCTELLVFVAVAVWLYRMNPAFRSNLRFGFEGFFSLAETGRWSVRSNQILRDMIVWPETLKTWLIGDGFFDNPRDVPDMLGQLYYGFYMKTDIGYLRYIFYFGVIGLIGMITVCVNMTVTCIVNLKGFTLLFLSFLLITLIGWLKVSSDIIMVFAPFLIMAYQQDAECTSSTT